MNDYTFQRHQNCEYFYQNSWMMGEGKYMCLRGGHEEVLFLEEIPLNCVKGFKPFHFPEPTKLIEDKQIEKPKLKPKPELTLYIFKR